MFTSNWLSFLIKLQKKSARKNDTFKHILYTSCSLSCWLMTEGKNICLQFWQGNGNNYHNILGIRKQTCGKFIPTPTLTHKSLNLQLKLNNIKQQRTTWVSFTPKNVLFFSRYTKERIRLNFVYIRKYAPLCSYQMWLKASIENRKIYMFVSIQSDCQVTASTLLTRSLTLM